MSEINNEEFNTLVSEFIKVKKRILQSRPLTKNTDKVEEYKTLLISNYNALLEYFNINSESLTNTNKSNILSKINHCRTLLFKCLEKLGYQVLDSSVSLSRFDSDVVMKVKSDSESNSGILDSNSELENTMATLEQKKAYVSMCASIIRDNYNGDPLSLDSFLDKIALLEDLTDPSLNSTFLNFVKSKLEAKAREALPDNLISVDQIKTALKEKIKPESSKVIAGKIAALGVRNNNYVEFSREAEELADAFKRSLIIEGITKAKSQEMAVEQTVTMCRLNAKTDLVKSILASSNFTDPKEVLAKMVIEQTNELKERQVLAIGANSGKNNLSYRNNIAGSFNNQNSYRRNNFRNFRGNNNRINNRVFGNNNRNFNNSGPFRVNNNNTRQRASVRSLNADVPQRHSLRDSVSDQEPLQN